MTTGGSILSFLTVDREYVILWQKLRTVIVAAPGKIFAPGL
jgi:hypothetical protein